MDCTVNTAAAEQRWIRRVDNGIGVLTGDVARDEFDRGGTSGTGYGLVHPVVAPHGLRVVAQVDGFSSERRPVARTFCSSQALRNAPRGSKRLRDRLSRVAGVPLRER